MTKSQEEKYNTATVSDEFECVLDQSMTVKRHGVAYLVPCVQPFVDYVGQRVRIVVPQSIDLILMTLPNSGGEYEIEKVISVPDKAGEFKSLLETSTDSIFGARSINPMTKVQEEKYKAAIPDVEALIEKHSYEAIRWVVNKLSCKAKLRKELNQTRREYDAKIRAIEEKLNA